MDSVTDGPPRQAGEAWARYRLLLEETALRREQSRRNRERAGRASTGRTAPGGQTGWTL